MYIPIQVAVKGERLSKEILNDFSSEISLFFLDIELACDVFT